MTERDVGVRTVDIWTTCDGREIAVADMSDHHLQNAIRYYIARGALGFPGLRALLDEQDRRKEAPTEGL